MLNFFMLLVVLLVTACGGSDNSQDEKGAPMGISVTDALKSDCPNGGAVINQGVDTDGNGEIDAGEVTSSDTVCNGGNGINGGNKIVKSIYCSGDLLGTVNLSVTYQVDIFESGDLFAAASVYGPTVEISASIMYAKMQNGSDTAPVIFTYDCSGTSNGGWWEMWLNRTTLVSYVVYTDNDVTGGQSSWTMPSSECTVNNY